MIKLFWAVQGTDSCQWVPRPCCLSTPGNLVIVWLRFKKVFRGKCFPLWSPSYPPWYSSSAHSPHMPCRTRRWWTSKLDFTKATKGDMTSKSPTSSSGLCVRSIPSLRKLRPISKTRLRPPITSLCKESVSLIRAKRTSRIASWIMKRLFKAIQSNISMIVYSS